MDANRQRLWLAAAEADFTALDAVAWDADRRALSLLGTRALPAPVGDAAAREAAARAALATVPEALDRYATRARVDASLVVGFGASSGAPWPTDHPAEPVSDLVLGHDDVLYVARGGFVEVIDPRRRWSDAVVVALAGFDVWRLAPAPEGGVWALERPGAVDPHTARLARLGGRPLPDGLQLTPGPGVFRPREENPDPPTLRLLPAAFAAGEAPVALASDAEGRPAALVWAADGSAALRRLAGDRWAAPSPLVGIEWPYSLAAHGDDRWALLAPGLAEVAVYPAAGGVPVGDYHPLVEHDGGPFVHAPPGPATLRTAAGEVRPVRRLSLPGRARRGEARARVFDGGAPGFTWHRLVIEADLPPLCGVTLHLAATESPDPPGTSAPWWPHVFGDRAAAEGVPRGVRLAASELPFHPGLGPCAEARPSAGIYAALVQRAGVLTRALSGRYLHLRVELHGDGRATPEVAAVRVWGPRFSYVERYLPELYRETVYGPDGDAPAARSTAPDFLERFLGLFEGVLTPLEDRVAHAHLLTDPQTAPEEALEWLAGWVGLSFDPALPPERRRLMIAGAVPLARQRGTLPGLEAALDLVTGGAVERGEVVIVEDFRLRRTFATILGADLRAVDDALTGGLTVTGNSIVGDTLILGQPERREFLALFDATLRTTRREDAAVDALFADLAWRVTVLVQREQGPELLGLVRRVVAHETPAHVEARVVAASHPLVIGLQALVGVDTYLGRRPPPEPIRIGRDRVGADRRVQSPPSLDPNLEGET